METRQFLLQAELDANALDAWIEAGWLIPDRDRGTHDLSEIDLARVMLIRDLKEKLDVSDDGVSVILNLVDQLHGLRRLLRDVLSAIGSQPETARDQFVARLRETCGFEQIEHGP